MFNNSVQLRNAHLFSSLIIPCLLKEVTEQFFSKTVTELFQLQTTSTGQELCQTSKYIFPSQAM